MGISWLQWSEFDLNSGLGGVEICARSLHREFLNLNVDSALSNSHKDLWDPKWTVIHTHGSSIPPLKWIFSSSRTALWFHTLHGETLDRMLACREYLWINGYRAQQRELLATMKADQLLAIHPALKFLKARKLARKPVVICGNGWNSGAEEELLPEVLERKVTKQPSWLYVGRWNDAVKNTLSVTNLAEDNLGIKIIAAPGPSSGQVPPNIFSAGKLTAGQIRSLMKKSLGLLLPSVYEGLPLVVLEALAYGIPVIASQVGGLKTLGGNFQGLYLFKNAGLGKNSDAMGKQIYNLQDTQLGVCSARAEHNRRQLKTWGQVAQTVLSALGSVRPELNLEIAPVPGQ